MKKLYKIKKDSVLCGVCAGISDITKINVKTIRIITCLLCLFEGLGAVIYLILALLLPDKKNVYK